MVDSIYSKLSKERKQLQEMQLVPEWMTTGGYQLFKDKYDTPDNEGSVYGAYVRIARAASQHMENKELWEKKFFNILWKGWLSCSTPVLANMGTDRGLPVSCSGNYIEDSIDGFYSSLKETAILTKHGFGTSSYLGDIRPRGSVISSGGYTSGTLPVIRAFVQASRDVSQGATRRGAWAGYLPILHEDFWELVTYAESNPDDLNIGWIISDEFISMLDSGDTEAITRYQRALRLKMVTGKGYFFFSDKANRHRPECYKERNLDVKASNLCSEIMLHSDIDDTFTCVLSSLNLAYYDDWKSTDAVFVATVFLDCVAQEFIEKGSRILGLDKAVRFTEKSRALGLGVCAFHTLLQKKMISFESFEAHQLNNEIFKFIRDEAVAASTFLEAIYGEAEWTRGTGRRNSHLLAIAPTKSTALIMGGVSEGISPDPKMVYTQSSAAGEIERVNPQLLEIMKKRGVYSRKLLDEISQENNGSVQYVDWLTDDEKKVFKTAFEIDQRAILRLASARTRYVDQGQSLNLFFDADEDEEYISEIHKEAYLDENILALYYNYSEAGVQASKNNCEACQ